MGELNLIIRVIGRNISFTPIDNNYYLINYLYLISQFSLINIELIY